MNLLSPYLVCGVCNRVLINGKWRKKELEEIEKWGVTTTLCFKHLKVRKRVTALIRKKNP